jgi:LuxR family maltose regulon positive regulatory protein
MAESELVRATESYSDAASVMRRTGNAYAIIRSLFGQSQMERAQGRLGRAMHVCRQAIAWSDQRGHPHPSVGMVHLALADLLRERGELDEAMHLATEGARFFGRLGLQLDADPHVFSFLAQSRIEQALGHIDAALELFHQAKALVETAESPPPQALLRAYEAQLRLVQGSLPAARDCAEKVMADKSHDQFRFDLDFYNLGYELVPVLPIQVLMARGRSAEDAVAFRRALSLLQHEAEDADNRGLVWLQIKTRILQALAYHALGDGERARESLEQALALAQPEAYVRVFADEGAPMADLLREMAVGGTRRQYVATLLSAIHPAQYVHHIARSV